MEALNSVINNIIDNKVFELAFITVLISHILDWVLKLINAGKDNIIATLEIISSLVLVITYFHSLFSSSYQNIRKATPEITENPDILLTLIMVATFVSMLLYFFDKWLDKNN